MNLLQNCLIFVFCRILCFLLMFIGFKLEESKFFLSMCICDRRSKRDLEQLFFLWFVF
jgi:hypothetical protein